MMDPIERIAEQLMESCAKSMALFVEIDQILDSADTIEAGYRRLVAKGYAGYVDLDQLDLIPYDIGRYRRCMDSMDEIKLLARKVFVVNFFEADALYIFNQEVSFSYACKMLSQIGPSLGHFSNHPTSKEVVHAELKLACNTPFFSLDSDLLCLESMPPRTNINLHIQENSASTSI